MDVGSLATVPILVDSTEVTAGLAYGLCSLPSGVSPATLISVVPGAALALFGGGSGPDFFTVVIEPGGVTGSHTVGCIYDLFGAESLGLGAGHEVVDLTYQAESDGSVALCFCDSLGIPVVETIFLDDSGGSLVPVQVCGSITVGAVCSPVFGLNCDFQDLTQVVAISWTNSGTYSAHDVFRNEVWIATLPGSQETYTDPQPSLTTEYRIESTCVDGEPVSSTCTVELSEGGDVNRDGLTNLADAIYLLSFLFSGGPDPAFVACP